jgi:copper chaperone CopZ
MPINLDRRKVLLVWLLGWAGFDSRAAVEEVSLRVENLRCSLCVRQVERWVGRLPEVLSTAVDPATGEVKVEARPGRSLNPAAVRRQIRRAGLEPAAEHEELRAVGEVRHGQRDRLVFRVAQTGEEYHLLEGPELLPLLQSLPAAGKSRVALRGRVHRHPEQLPPSLSILSFEIEAKR